MTKDELLEIYNTLLIDKSYDLMNFILLNKIIDENDGADFFLIRFRFKKPYIILSLNIKIFLY